MKVFFILLLALACHAASAQIDTLLGRAGVAQFINSKSKHQYFELLPVNRFYTDTTINSLKPAKYWLTGDFNHDGLGDLVLYVSKDSGSYRELAIYSAIKKNASYISLANYYTSGFSANLATIVEKISLNAQNYIVLTSLKTTYRNHEFSDVFSKDTVSITRGKPMIYTRHPTIAPIKQVEFSASGCYGTCPVFELTINADRTVQYKGIRYVTRTGYYDLVISQSDLTYLSQLINNLNIPGLKKNYSVASTDDQTGRLKIVYQDGSSKEITDYGMQGTYGLAVLYNFLLGLRNF